MKGLEIGQQIESTVVAVSGDSVFIDMSSKSEGVIDAAEFEQGSLPKPGDKIRAFYAGSRGSESIFTTKIAGDKADADMLRNAFENGIPVEGKVAAEIKGGFEVRVGESRAFCPYSQMGGRKKAESADFVGRVLPFKIQEFKDDGRSIVLSNRAIEEGKRLEAVARLESSIKVGQTVSCTVSELRDFGAFVDVQGFRALLPISEISYERVDDLSKHLSVGQEVQAKVIRADWKDERVSVSMKALLSDPWDEAARKFGAGAKLDGTICRIADFGIFVNLAPGIDGLVHRSTLDGVDSNTNLKKAFKTGAKFSVVVEKVDSEQKRISLRPASSSQQDDDTARFLGGQKDDGDTYNPFAALLKT